MIFWFGEQSSGIRCVRRKIKVGGTVFSIGLLQFQFIQLKRTKLL